MRIAMISAECAPIAKAGGLGDVVHGLSRALLEQGDQVTVILPAYDHLDRTLLRDARETAHAPPVWFDGGWHPCRVVTATLDGIPCRLLDPLSDQGWFQRGRIYGETDDAERFACFCRAALDLALREEPPPDILHCHDWHTGLVPVLLHASPAARDPGRSRVCYSLHNLGYQGVAPASLLARVGLDAAVLAPGSLEQPGAPGFINPMRGGIRHADAVNTVSPRHAWEVLNTEQGMGLQEILTTLADQGRFGGILNGLDPRLWNPATDALIPGHYDAERPSGKRLNRRALRRRLGLIPADKPILGIVSRLDHQKGVGLMEAGIGAALARGAQVALLGTALDPGIAARFAALARSLDGHPDCRLVLTYDEALAHLIYAGADLLLIPSLYEPCGLSQMIALRYGTLPVARRVGGLADTLEDVQYSVQPFARRNAWLFDDPTPEALDFALERAIGLWRQRPDLFGALRRHAMRIDRSWRESAARYRVMYARARAVP